VPPYDNAVVFSVDVECVAVGAQHHDRAVAQIGLVDCFGRMLLNVLVKPSLPVKSYLTPLTGLTAEKVPPPPPTPRAPLRLLLLLLPRSMKNYCCRNLESHN
jgi:RNA exonuclease 4